MDLAVTPGLLKWVCKQAGLSIDSLPMIHTTIQPYLEINLHEGSHYFAWPLVLDRPVLVDMVICGLLPQ
jgi:hypothetical protein